MGRGYSHPIFQAATFTKTSCFRWSSTLEPVSEVGLVVGHGRGKMKACSDMEY